MMEVGGLHLSFIFTHTHTHIYILYVIPALDRVYNVTLMAYDLYSMSLRNIISSECDNIYPVQVQNNYYVVVNRSE